jgi:hypothetical protein
MKETGENHKLVVLKFTSIMMIVEHSFICEYWIVLAVNTAESLLCFPTWAKFRGTAYIH